jgi:hypothetical protein
VDNTPSTASAATNQTADHALIADDPIAAFRRANDALATVTSGHAGGPNPSLFIQNDLVNLADSMGSFDNPQGAGWGLRSQPIPSGTNQIGPSIAPGFGTELPVAGKSQLTLVISVFKMMRLLALHGRPLLHKRHKQFNRQRAWHDP